MIEVSGLKKTFGEVVAIESTRKGGALFAQIALIMRFFSINESPVLGGSPQGRACASMRKTKRKSR